MGDEGGECEGAVEEGGRVSYDLEEEFMVRLVLALLVEPLSL